ncbi:MAG: hypothetical protein ACYS0D_13360 [Planctomycetota bacterium]
MKLDRLIQAGALAVMVGAASAGGTILPRIADLTQRHTLRYTDVAVEGAPPFVTIGTAIGALRGMIVNWLWIKVHFMKEKGLYYEIMEDADLITKLQPRFAAVWAFHGHNMAYNISVAHNTSEERWEWVSAGIDLVRGKGLRYNPDNLQLHKELAFWFSHKIEGVADDSHFYYKTELAREWHAILGQPPYDHEARIAWLKVIADAPETLQGAERRTPGVAALVDRLREGLSPFEQQFRFDLDKTFLQAYAEWQAIKRGTAYAQLRGIAQKPRADFVAFDEIASDPEVQDAWETLLAHVRKRVLLDEYNMDPQIMYEYTRDFGPIDWRSGFAHALYWALKGSETGEIRVLNEEDVYKIVNNDRMKIQAMQGMARWGRIAFDPFSSDLPSRLPDPRWIDVIDRYWEELSYKHRDTRGPGADLFMGFHQNFLSASVREMYRSGELERAQRYLDRLHDLYPWDPKYTYDLESFVWSEVEEQYAFQPHLAPSEVAAALRYGFRVGLGLDRPEVYRRSINFANRVTLFFKENNYNDFVTKMGTARLGDLINQLARAAPAVFGQLMVDETVPMIERLTIWRRAPEELQRPVYDGIRPEIERQLAYSELGAVMPVDTALPEPIGMEAYRQQVEAARQAARERAGEAEPAQVERRTPGN